MSGGSGISVHTHFNPLAIFLYFVKPVVDVDGEQQRVRWGDTFIPAGPGQHTVTIWFPYLTWKQTGKASLAVDVPSAGAASVRYKAPQLMTRPGKISLG
jgi:hypothetical protein